MNSLIAVCLKWTPANDDDVHDHRFGGVSAADQAALEVALRLAGRLGTTVVAVSAGRPAADRALRDALAAGAAQAVRLDMAADADSRDVAFEIAHVTRAAGIVVCGDYSLDRGSGSVPALIAHHHRRAQALGLVDVDVDASDATSIRAVRRLDGGRRELLGVPTPCVLSVEGSVATLRRAGLRDVLASRSATIDQRPTPPAHHRPSPAVVVPYRPRPRVIAAPSSTDPLERLRRLTDATAAPARGETVVADPGTAAELISDRLRLWGYLGPHR
jgi:electron transfer flavoprotein beta subunit